VRQRRRESLRFGRQEANEMNHTALGFRYLLTSAKYHFLKSWADFGAFKGFASAALEYDFHRGAGRMLEDVSVHKVFPEIVGQTWTTVGITWSAEAPYLCGALKAIGAERALEIGTNLGETTLQLAANLPEGGIMYTVDLDPSQAPELADHYSRHDRALVEKEEQRLIGRYFRGTPYEKRIVQILQDSATIDYGKYFEQVDMAYIDGGHSYEQVRADTEKVLPRVRKGGAIFWHDYQPGCQGVTRYLHELAKQYPVKFIRRTQLAVLRA
jgi:predicted O-methyltransferase YrrM